MQPFKSMRLLASLTLAFVCTAIACSDKNDDNKTPTPLTISTESLTLGAKSGDFETLTITTSEAWTATPSGDGYSLDKSSGTGDATIRVSATVDGANGEEKQLGSIVITAKGAESPKIVAVSQEGAKPELLPEKVVITTDFARGPSIATPALPATSETALTGRHEYTIEGYKFAIYADAADNGKLFWNDLTLNYAAEEPNKALYFSKIDAYVEFPAIAGLHLSTIEYFYTSAINDIPDFDITTPDGLSMNHSLNYADDGSGMTFALLTPALNTPYRLTIVNRKNAQVSKFVLTYNIPK